MSMELMVKAMKLKVGNPTRKLVLLKLADNANDQGECWPSYQNIADHCEVSRRSVMSHIKSLEQEGILRREYRKGEKGNKSNLYHLRLEPSERFTPPSENISPPSENGSPPPSENISPRTSHSLEPVKEPYIDSSSKNRKSYPTEFEFMWGEKPGRGSDSNPKAKALRACQARIKQGATWREMAEGLRRYYAYCKATGKLDTQYVMQMATFFGPEEHFKNDWTVNNEANNGTTNSGKGANYDDAMSALKQWAEERGVDTESIECFDSPLDSNDGDLRNGSLGEGLRENTFIDLDDGDFEIIDDSDKDRD